MIQVHPQTHRLVPDRQLMHLHTLSCAVLFYYSGRDHWSDSILHVKMARFPTNDGPNASDETDETSRARGDAEAVSAWSCDLSALSRFGSDGSDSYETLLKFSFPSDASVYGLVQSMHFKIESR